MSLVFAVLALVIAALITRRLCDPGSRLYMLDHPNRRSLHVSPTPRGGGLAIFVAILISGTLAAAVYAAGVDLVWLAVPAFLIAAVSFLDDWLTINLGYRMATHFAAAGLLMWGGFGLGDLVLPSVLWPLAEPVAIGFSLLFVVWMVNLYNFMDGMDGFAAGMAVVGFGSFALLGWLAGDARFTAFNLIVAAAAAGFLVFNFPPARIFMGDIGSSLLGFLAAAFALWADRDGIFPLWVSVLIFSPFIVDATVTLLKRIVRRERFWQAHKTHYYQRLVQLGWGHKRTVLWEYALMVLCSIWALSVWRQPVAWQWLAIGFWIVSYPVLMVVVRALETRANPRN